jgi:tetratricopeptide (TPR) repeat protein
MLARAQALMPADVRKAYRSKYFYLRGALRLDLGDRQGAAGDFETALTLWPSATNQATKPLEDLYRQAGDEKALKALQERVKRRKR